MKRLILGMMKDLFVTHTNIYFNTFLDPEGCKVPYYGNRRGLEGFQGVQMSPKVSSWVQGVQRGPVI